MKIKQHFQICITQRDLLSEVISVKLVSKALEVPILRQVKEKISIRRHMMRRVCSCVDIQYYVVFSIRTLQTSDHHYNRSLLPAQSPPSTRLLYAYKYNNMLMVGICTQSTWGKAPQSIVFLGPIDIFLKKWPHFGCALAVINEKMKKYSTKTTLVAFCWTWPASSQKPAAGSQVTTLRDTSVCQNIEIYWEVKDTRKLIIAYLSRCYLYHR